MGEHRRGGERPAQGNDLEDDALSGGEKSLTALALLFAVYRIRSTPFYILDEVRYLTMNLRRLAASLYRQLWRRDPAHHDHPPAPHHGDGRRRLASPCRATASHQGHQPKLDQAFKARGVGRFAAYPPCFESNFWLILNPRYQRHWSLSDADKRGFYALSGSETLISADFGAKSDNSQTRGAVAGASPSRG